MAAADTEIANLALGHLGVAKQIANVETENSQEARAINLFYQTALQKVLRDFSWPFATRYVKLALVTECPTPEWRFAYRVPPQCLEARRILHPGWGRKDSAYTRVRFRIAGSDQGELLYTDMRHAELEYTFNEQNVSYYPPDFVMAFSLLLAALAAPRLTAGDPFKLGGKCMDAYMEEITKAQSSGANEEAVDRPPESEFILAREGGDYRSEIPGVGDSVIYPGAFVVE